MKKIPEGITLSQARGLLLSLPAELETETLPVASALGRVLAKDYYAPYMLPSFSKSPLDGYAFCSRDTQNATRETPVTLKIIEEIPAGKAPEKQIGSREAAKILTGAPIPLGADAVVRYEDTRFTPQTVTIFSKFAPDTNIIHAGEDILEGAPAATKGEVITPALAGLFASLGICQLSVYRQPLAALVSTGNELVDISQPLSPGKIHNSSQYTLSGYLRESGARIVSFSLAKDEDADIASAISQGIDKADLVITTGGVSVGDYDRVRAALESLGADILFWRIAIKPGAALVAALLKGKLVLGLSGNPGSAATALHLLGLPYVRKLEGRNQVLPEKIQVYMAEKFPKASPCGRYLRGRLKYSQGRVYFTQTGSQGNNIITSFVNCNVLAEIPAGSPALPAGTLLDAYLI